MAAELHRIGLILTLAKSMHAKSVLAPQQATSEIEPMLDHLARRCREASQARHEQCQQERGRTPRYAVEINPGVRPEPSFF